MMLDDAVFTAAEFAASLLVISLIVVPLWRATQAAPALIVADTLREIVKRGVPPGSNITLYYPTPIPEEALRSANISYTGSGGGMCLLLYNSTGAVHGEGC